MNSIDVSFLFYKIHPDYYKILDGPEDPNILINFEKSVVFKEYMQDCSLKIYIKTIIEIFIEKYPNIFSLEYALLDLKEDKEDYSKDSFRNQFKNDISSLVFKTVNAYPDDEELKDEECERLTDLVITFKQPQQHLLLWIQDVLQNIEYYIHHTNSTSQKITLEHHVIESITVEDTNVITITIKPESYIEYEYVE